jgi:O-antigen/teichoic acid export membrane protein
VLRAGDSGSGGPSGREVRPAALHDRAPGWALINGRVTPDAVRSSVRGSGTYALATVLQRGITFALLPVYTRALSPDEYGQIAVILTIAFGASALLSFGLENAMFRTYIRLRDEPDERWRFVNSVGLLGLIGPFLLAIVVIVVWTGTLADLFDVPSSALALGIGMAAGQVALTVVPMAILRAQERLGTYVQLTLIHVGTTTLLTLTLVVGFDLGVTGWLIAGAVGVAAALIAGIAVVDHRWALVVDKRHLVGALAYGLPLLPHAAAHWGLALSDRLILGAFVAPATIGLYQLAFNATLPISTIGIAMNRGTAPVYALAADSDAHRRQLASVITQHVIITSLAAMIIVVCGPPLIDVLLPRSYGGAATYIPWLATGAVLYGMYLVPMNVIAILSGRTRWVWIATVIAAAVNIGLNLLSVPVLGAGAAAVNSAIGYGVLLLGVIWFMRGLNEPLRLDWGRMAGGAAIVAIATACGILLTRDTEPLQSLVIAVVVALAAPVLLVLTGIWRLPARGQRRAE